MTPLAMLVAVTFLGVAACSAFRSAGRQEGYQLACDRAAELHGMRMARINVALGTLTMSQIETALASHPTDKIGALLAALDRNAARASANAKARAAEWSNP